MKAFFTNELTRLFLFIALCLIIAAVATPSIYSWGKEFAAEPNSSATPQWLISVKASMAKGYFYRYFNRVFMLTVIVLFYPFLRSLKGGNTEVKAPLLSRLNPHRQGWLDIVTGFVYASGYMGILLMLLLKMGWIKLDPSVNVGSVIISALTTAFIVSVLEEWFFRGVLYDVIRRRHSAKMTIIGLSIFFAALHFLQPHTLVSDPHSPTAGFELLKQIGIQFLHPELILGSFITLFAVGVILAYARHRTSYLWLPIGLHAGWVFSMKFINDVSIIVPGKANPLFYSQDMRGGILPILFVALTGVATYFLLRRKNPFTP